MSSDIGLNVDQRQHSNEDTDMNRVVPCGAGYYNAHQGHNVHVILVPDVGFSYSAV